MKKFICTTLATLSIGICVAQSQIEYCDVYARGSWNNLTITIMSKQNVEHLRGDIASVLNKMSERGWVLEEAIAIPRHGIPVTRHKLHFIMKREISENNISEGLELNVGWSPISEFINEDIEKLDKKNRREKIDILNQEIVSNIDKAMTAQDLVLVRKKIQAIEDYNNNLVPKDYVIVDIIYDLKTKFKKKSKKLGISNLHI